MTIFFRTSVFYTTLSVIVIQVISSFHVVIKNHDCSCRHSGYLKKKMWYLSIVEWDFCQQMYLLSHKHCSYVKTNHHCNCLSRVNVYIFVIFQGSKHMVAVPVIVQSLSTRVRAIMCQRWLPHHLYLPTRGTKRGLPLVFLIYTAMWML